MTTQKVQQNTQPVALLGFDLIVKYAVLLSWLIYGAGLTRTSGFLRSLGVPTEATTYGLPLVLSQGAYSILEVLFAAAFPIALLKICREQKPQSLWRTLGLVLPAGVFLGRNYWLFQVEAAVSVRIYYATYFLCAAYIVVYLFTGDKVREWSLSTQLLVGVLLFFLVVEGSGYLGDLDAYATVNERASIQLVLAPNAIPGATKLGIKFTSEPGLTEPLNVVALTETVFYVGVPLRLDASPSQAGMKLEVEREVTVAIPRSQVIMASTRR